MAQDIQYLDVFVSSTSKDLIPYRNAVREAIMKIEGLHPIMMEDFNATDRNAMQKCYDEVARSEIFIGIYAHRYGYAPDENTIYFREDDTQAHGDGETSITKWEFTWAKEMNLPMCCFVVDPAYDWTDLRDDKPEDIARLEAFKAEITQFVVGFFTEPTQLALKVTHSLVEIQKNYDKRKIRNIQRKRPFTAPSMPERFINRPEIFDPLVDRLINGGAVALRTALAGGSGFGKTTLAIATCHDVRVRQHFTDGILWVQFRQDMTDNDVRALIEEQFKHITGETRTFKDLELAKTALKDELAKRHILFILDDVWQPDYGKIFVFPDPQARANTLITTRQKEVVVNASLQQGALDVSELQGTQGGDLLALELMPTPSEKTLLDDLANTLGNWAQMIELVAAELRMLVGADGYSIPDAITDIRHRLKAEGFISFSHDDEGNRTKNLRASLELSLSRLKHLRPRFAELAIFREDNNIPATSIALLWRGTANMDAIQTERALREMNRLSLFTRQHFASTPLSQKWIRLHDVIRALMADTLADKTGLHRTWTTTCDPYHLPDEYAWRNIGYHLKYADDLPRLRGLLLDYAWLQAKLTATDPNALIADCDWLPDDETILLLKSAFSLSISALDIDKSALAHQLLGRLMYLRKDNYEIRLITDAIVSSTSPLIQMNVDTPYPSHIPAGGALLRIFSHEQVIDVIELRDGRLLSWGKDGTLCLWTKDGVKLNTLLGHKDSINGARELIDGKLLSWSDDKTLILWSESGLFLHSFNGHKAPVIGAIQLKDGRILSWSQNKSLYQSALKRLVKGNSLNIWSMDGVLEQVVIKDKCTIDGAYQLSNEFIICWGQRSKIDILFDEEHMIYIFDKNGNPLDILPKKLKYSVISLNDNQFMLWAWKSNRKKTSLFEKIQFDFSPFYTTDGFIWDVDYAFLLDKNRILLSAYSTLTLWDNGEQKNIDGGDASSEGTFYAIGLRNGNIISWNSQDYDLSLRDNEGNLLKLLEKHDRNVTGAIQLNDGKIVSWGDDSLIYIWDEEGNYLHSLNYHLNSIKQVFVLQDNRLLSLGYNYDICIWDIDKYIEVPQPHSAWLEKLHITSDGNVLSFGADSRVSFWRKDGSLYRTLPTQGVANVIELSTGRFLTWQVNNLLSIEAPPPSRFFLHLWDISGVHLQSLEGHTLNVAGAIELSNKYILSWSWDNTVRLWDADGNFIKVMGEHGYWVVGAIQLSNGKIVTWSQIPEIFWWDMEGNLLNKGVKYENRNFFDNGKDVDAKLDIIRIVELNDDNIIFFCQNGVALICSFDAIIVDAIEIDRWLGKGYTINAKELDDKRVLIYSKDKIYLWDRRVGKISTLDNHNYDPMKVVVWAKKHHFRANLLFELWGHKQINADLSICLFDGFLMVYETKTGVTKHKFYGDASFRCFVLFDNVIVIGDFAGRVIWVKVQI